MSENRQDLACDSKVPFQQDSHLAPMIREEAKKEN
jgi:hypothetical protein